MLETWTHPLMRLIVLITLALVAVAVFAHDKPSPPPTSAQTQTVVRGTHTPYGWYFLGGVVVGGAAIAIYESRDKKEKVSIEARPDGTAMLSARKVF